MVLETLPQPSDLPQSSQGCEKENPGLTNGQIALISADQFRTFCPFLWKLKKYCRALEVERSGLIRTPGLAEFLEIPCVKRILLKLGSKKTRTSWGRKLFKYQKRLVTREICPDIEVPAR
jgi:hypothetical protein